MEKKKSNNRPALLPMKNEEVVGHLLDYARQCGVSAAEAALSSGTGLYVAVRKGEVERMEHENDHSLTMTVYLNGRKGSASSSDISIAAQKQCVEAACAIARHTSEDRYAGLAAAEYMARSMPTLDLYHPWELTVAEAVEICRCCEAEALAYDTRIENSEGASVNTYAGDYTYGNTHGFLSGWQSSWHNLDCSVIAQQNGSMQCEGWYSKTRRHVDLQPAAEVGTMAAKRAISRLGAVKIATKQVPVLFEAGIAAGLFAAFATAIAGSGQYRRASFLLDSLGQAVFPEWLHITEKPHLPLAMGSAPFDNDGVATREKTIIDGGYLRSYLLDAYYARCLGMETTGNAGGVHNLCISDSGQDFKELLQQLDCGLLVTELIGFGINQVTGDYSRGAVGFWVEGGEISHPLEEITIAGNLREMLQQIVAVGNDVDRRRNILSGSVLVENMTVAGNV